MAGPFDLTGQDIENTYQRVLQTDGTLIYDGTGSLFTISGSGGNIDTGSFVTTSSFNAYTGSNTSQFAGTASYAQTASYVQNAQTASFVQNAQTASFVVSASYAQTASFVQNAQTASYVQNAQTASYVQNAQTASFVQNAISSSFSQTASYFSGTVISASYAQTASYVQNAQTASFVASASFAQTASYATYAANGGVTKIIAGGGITISPSLGLGDVTINSTTATFNTATGSYGSFFDTGSVLAASTTAVYSMSLNTTDISNGVFISASNGDNTRVKFTNAGVYNLQFSSQFSNTDNSIQDVVIWVRKNGTDITDSSGVAGVPPFKAGSNGQVIASWNYYLSLSAGDFIQMCWHVEQANVITLETIPAGVGPTHPRTPSTILTANRVDTFLSNTGSFSGSFTGNFTGSLLGTATTASFAISSSRAVSSSFATTASYVRNAVSASYATVAQTVLNASLFALVGSPNTFTSNQIIQGYLTLQGSLNQGTGVTNGNASHAQGNTTTAGYYGYYSGTTGVTAGVFELAPAYGDLTSIFTSSSFALFDDPSGLINGTPSVIKSQVSSSIYITGGIYDYTEVTLFDTTIDSISTGLVVGIFGTSQPAGANYTIGNYSHAEGESTTTIGLASHAEGYSTLAQGYYSHAEGESTTATGEASHAEGLVTIALGSHSHAEGSLAKAIGDYSHAEGDNTQAKGDYSHAEGQETISSGSYSHAEGYLTIALGDRSHAEGRETQALGTYSHAEGNNTIAQGDYQHVQGAYNIASSAQSAFIVGNGSDVARSNLIFASGSQVQVTGSLIVSGSGTFINIGPAVFSGSITSTAGFTGSFQGTATTASYAQTASFVQNAQTASFFSGTVVSASYAQTASFVTGSIFTNGNRALSASYAISSSFAVSASWAPSSGGGGASIYRLTSQTLPSASWVATGSYYTSSFANANITTTTRVDFTPDNASYTEVTTAGILPQVTVIAGTASFYSLFPPQTNIIGEITIFPTV